MKKLYYYLVFCLTLSCCCISPDSLAQPKPIEAGARRLYLKLTYDLTPQQISAYEGELAKFKMSENALQKQQIPSTTYKMRVDGLYADFVESVSVIFTSSQYDVWRNVVRNNELYRIFAEDWQIPASKIIAIADLEKEVFDMQEDAAKNSIDVKSKIEADRKIYKYKLNRNNEILGEAVADAYASQKLARWNAYKEMDKYTISYEYAVKIAIIERKFELQRQQACAAKGDTKFDYHGLVAQNNAEKIAALRAALPKNIFEKWKAKSDKTLDIELSSYGLNSQKIQKYKDLYNKYIVQEHLILYKSPLKKDEKLLKLNTANDEFCNAVSSLFSPQSFEQWKGRRLYNYESKLKRKKIIK